MAQRKKRQPQPRSGFFTKLVILALLAAIRGGQQADQFRQGIRPKAPHRP